MMYFDSPGGLFIALSIYAIISFIKMDVPDDELVIRGIYSFIQKIIVYIGICLFPLIFIVNKEDDDKPHLITRIISYTVLSLLILFILFKVNHIVHLISDKQTYDDGLYEEKVVTIEELKHYNQNYPGKSGTKYYYISDLITTDNEKYYGDLINVEKGIYRESDTVIIQYLPNSKQIIDIKDVNE